ncbi:uncharacterized protein LOC125345183 [Perognathus longimembris pacificus]|uniref:uncharacterized protein LOC125345183 n=1 Tax=Perognathus longimembris pacificus TaxID=214514 RepID=UPI0020197137|nr:uncharacterized protein LOC125345183 [Perognathus longimembris pacificus]
MGIHTSLKGLVLQSEWEPEELANRRAAGYPDRVGRGSDTGGAGFHVPSPPRGDTGFPRSAARGGSRRLRARISGARGSRGRGGPVGVTGFSTRGPSAPRAPQLLGAAPCPVPAPAGVSADPEPGRRAGPPRGRTGTRAQRQASVGVRRGAGPAGSTSGRFGRPGRAERQGAPRGGLGDRLRSAGATVRAARGTGAGSPPPLVAAARRRRRRAGRERAGERASDAPRPLPPPPRPGVTPGAPQTSPEEGSSLDEIGFNWGEYLEETGARAAPHASFKHVEISIQSNFQPGMKLEVANKNNPDTYWVATIITTCGQLLLLCYCGYGEDRRADFWCDVVIADLHPVGWCTQNNKILMPPDAGPPAPPAAAPAPSPRSVPPAAAPHRSLSPPSTRPPALPGPSAVFHTGPAPPAPAGTRGLGSASRPSGWPTCSSSCCTCSFPTERSACSCSSRVSLSTFNAATCSSRPFSCLPHWARSSSACWHAWTWVCKSAFWLAHLLLQLLHPLLPHGVFPPQLLLTGVSLHLQRGHLLFQALQLSSTLGPLLQRLLARVDLGLQVGLLAGPPAPPAAAPAPSPRSAPPAAAPHGCLSPPSTRPPALPGPSAVFHTGPAPPAPAGTRGLGSASRPSGITSVTEVITWELAVQGHHRSTLLYPVQTRTLEASALGTS